jgi:hypothetical protein
LAFQTSEVSHLPPILDLAFAPNAKRRDEVEALTLPRSTWA